MMLLFEACQGGAGETCVFFADLAHVHMPEPRVCWALRIPSLPACMRRILSYVHQRDNCFWRAGQLSEKTFLSPVPRMRLRILQTPLFKPHAKLRNIVQRRSQPRHGINCTTIHLTSQPTSSSSLTFSFLKVLQRVPHLAASTDSASTPSTISLLTISSAASSVSG